MQSSDFNIWTVDGKSPWYTQLKIRW